MLALNFKPFPILITERLILRQITNNDTEALFVIRSNKEVMKYIGRPLAQTMEDVMDLIKLKNESLLKNESITWAITLKPGIELIGTIGFYRTEFENYRSEIGYLLHPAFQGKGILHEAMGVAIDYGFREMRLHSIEGKVDPMNAASIRVLEKCNFVREALMKENFYFNGQFLDTAIYSLLANYK